MLMALHEHAELHLLGKPMLAQSGKHATPPTIARHIYRNATQARQGRWHEVPDAIFYFKNNHIVVTKPDGTFITILKNAQNNRWFNQAGILWQK